MQKRFAGIFLVLQFLAILSRRVGSSECPRVPGLINPINIFHQYFKQTIKIFNPNEKQTSVELLYYRVQKKRSHVHRFVFRLKNTYANRYEYVGIVSVVPKKEILSGRNKHYIIRYINSADLLDTITLLGVYEVNEKRGISCGNMKKIWLEKLLKDPYIVTKTETTKENNDYISSDDVTRMFSLFFVTFQKILKSFGIEVSTGQLGFDTTILNILLEVYHDFDFITVIFLKRNNQFRKR
jgi:hypothetical protein